MDGDTAYVYALNHMANVRARRKVEGAEMLIGWQTEFRYHQFVAKLIERTERRELEAIAAERR